jgi:hypothetical protein
MMSANEADAPRGLCQAGAGDERLGAERLSHFNGYRRT